MENYTKYDVILIDFGEAEFAGEQGGVRPAVILQNDKGNKYSDTVIVIPFTSKEKPNLPTHCLFMKNNKYGLKKDSTLLGECIRQLSKQRIKGKLGHFADIKDRERIDRVLNANFAN